MRYRPPNNPVDGLKSSCSHCNHSLLNARLTSQLIIHLLRASRYRLYPLQLQISTYLSGPRIKMCEGITREGSRSKFGMDFNWVRILDYKMHCAYFAWSLRTQCNFLSIGGGMSLERKGKCYMHLTTSILRERYLNHCNASAEGTPFITKSIFPAALSVNTSNERKLQPPLLLLICILRVG